MKTRFFPVVLIGFALTAGTARAQLTITSSGQIGIGITTPDANSKLHVEHDDYYAGYFTSDRNSATTKVLRAEFTGTGSQSAMAVYGKSAPQANYGIGGYFEGASRGVMGVGATSGTGNRYGVWAYANYGSSTNYGVYSYGAGGTTNYAGYFSGNVTVTGTFSNPSDENLKENVDSLRAVLPQLTQLRPISFDYSSDPQYQHMNLARGKQFGFLAQELETIFPNLVSIGVHPSAEESTGGEGGEPIIHKSINYIALIPILVEAVKEQQEMIEELQKQLNNLSQK